MWEMVTRQEVYPGLSAFDVMEGVVGKNLRPPLDLALVSNDEIRALMRLLWSKNADDRLPFEEIIPRLQEIKKNSKTKRDSGGGRKNRLKEEHSEEDPNNNNNNNNDHTITIIAEERNSINNVTTKQQ